MTYVAMLVSFSASVIYALVRMPDTRGDQPDADPGPAPPETDGVERIRRLAEDISDHGGIPNTDSERAIAANVKAIRAAAAAAPNNTVYLPEGEWFIGALADSDGDALRAGSDDAHGVPAGLGFLGAGPDKTRLTWGAMQPGTKNTIRYCATEHTDAVWQDLTYIGRWRHFVRNGYDLDEGGQWGIVLEGDASGDLTLRNVRLQSMAGNGVFMGYGLDVDLTVDRCTFYDNGIGTNQAAGGRAHQHHIGAWADGDSSLTVRDSEFRLTSGSVINAHGPGDGSGTYRVENVYAEGAGLSFHKITNAGTVINKNVQFVGETDELLEELVDTSRAAYLYRLGGDETYSPTVELHDVHMRRLPGYALRVTSGCPLTICGGTDGPVSVDSVATLNSRPAALSGSSGEIHFDGYGDLSVHDVGGEVCDLDNSRGRIGTLRWGRQDALGALGDVTIGNRRRGERPFEPDVPSREEVGVGSGPKRDAPSEIQE